MLDAALVSLVPRFHDDESTRLPLLSDDVLLAVPTDSELDSSTPQDLAPLYEQTFVTLKQGPRQLQGL